MLSDRALEALHAVQQGIARHREAIAVAAERVEAHLASLVEDPTHARAASELGAFAAARMDVEKFAAFLGDRPVLDDLERALLRHAALALREHAALPDERFHVEVPSGGRLNLALSNFFDAHGRAFGASILAELVRTGRYDANEHAVLMHGLPRHRWSRAERMAAPPVVVSIDGADLWAGEVAQFLDGSQKVVFVVRPPAPPVLLARLITPGTLVLQTTKGDAIASAMQSAGAAVAALMPEGAAEFLHVPDASKPLHERLQVSFTPAGARKAVQSWSAWQQEEELRQLLAMSAAPVAPIAPVNGKAVDPADRLAGWLLEQARLPAVPA